MSQRQKILSASVGEPEMLPNGKKLYKIKGNHMEVDGKYSIIKPVGYGAYGFVCAAQDTATGKKVAIKKISKVFEDLIDGKRILREIKLLPILQHENIMGILDIMQPSEDWKTFKDLYIVCELMETDLHQVIRSQQKLTEEHHQYFIFQVLRALKYMHSAGVIHRDLKPGNLLVDGNCDVKICDFGLARGGVNTLKPDDQLTDYVVTRWYRPPELLLMSSYSAAIDIWSCGCILGELVNRKALFPGRDYIHQLNLITEYIPIPSKEELKFIASEDAQRYLRNMPRKQTKTIHSLIPNASKECIDFIEKMLVFAPEKRITAADAIKHPYLAHLYDPEDDIEYVPDPKNQVDWEFDNRDVKEPELRKLIWEEARRYNPSMPAAK